MEIARNITTIGTRIELLAKKDGKRIRFVFESADEAYKAHKNLLKGGADYLDIQDEHRRSRWASAPIARDMAGTTW